MKLKDSKQIDIMEATGRFEFLRCEWFGHQKNLVFWDNNFDVEIKILADVELSHLMQWITEFFAKEAFLSGKDQARREIRDALDI